MSPQTNKKQIADSSALERLKNIQANIKRQWHGISVEFSGRPGTAKTSTKSLKQIDDEDRFRVMHKVMIKLKEIEEDNKNHDKGLTTQ